MGSSAGMGGNSVRGERGGGVRIRGSGGGRLLAMVGRPLSGDCRTGPQTPYATTPRGIPLGKCGSPWVILLGGGPLEKFGLRPGHTILLGEEPLANFGLLGRMDTDQVRAPLRRGNHSNPSPHDIPPMGGLLAIFFPRPRHKLSHRVETPRKFWFTGADGHKSG